MKKVLLLFTILFCSIVLQGQTPNTTLIGTATTNGQPFTGTLWLTLTQPGVVLATGGCGGPLYVVPGIPKAITIVAGAMQGTQQVWGADCLNPSPIPGVPLSGIPYNVQFKDTNGNVLTSDQWLIAGPTFDIGAAASVLHNPGTLFVPVPGATGASGPNCSVISPPGQCILTGTAILNGDPPGGTATAAQAATQHYVDTSLMLNVKALGCSTALADNSPCFAAMTTNLTGNKYFFPPGNYNVQSCTPFIQNLPQHFEIAGAAWGSSTITYTGPAINTTPTNTTGWWVSGATTMQATVAPHVNDPVLAYQNIAGLAQVTGIQVGTTVTSVTGAGPFTVGLSKAVTATQGSVGSPVPVSFGWQCIFSIGGDDTNWFTIRDLGFAYTNLPQAPSNNLTDYPATAILMNTSGILANGIHDFAMKDLYFTSGSRGIASTKNTIGNIIVPVWGGNFENIVGAQGTVGVSGMQGATVDFANIASKGGGMPRLSFKNIYNRQTINEPQMSIQRVDALGLRNIESNSAQDVVYDFDNDYDMHLDTAHIEFFTATTSTHAAIELHSSSAEVSNVDISAHVCPTGTTCNTSPASPIFYAIGYNGSVPGTLTTNNINLFQPYNDSRGYCLTTGTWSLGQTTLTLNTPISAQCPAGLAGIASGQLISAQGIHAGTSVIVSAGPTYALSLPADAPGSSTAITFSTTASYVVHAGTGAVASGSRIGGSTGFNGDVLSGDASNELFFSADNAFRSHPCFIAKKAASPTSPPDLHCPGIISQASGSTTGLPAGDICEISLHNTGTGTFPAIQYREIAWCHDNGAGGLSGFGVYTSDNAIRGAENFTKIFSCDKTGNCASTGSMTVTGLVSTTPDNISTANCLATATVVRTPCNVYNNSFRALGASGTSGVITLYTSNSPAGAIFKICPSAVVETVGTAGTINLQATFTTPGGGSGSTTTIGPTGSLTSTGLAITACTTIPLATNSTFSFAILAVGGTGSPVWETNPIVTRIQ